MNMDVLVVSACSGDKKYDKKLDCETLDKESREELVRRNQEISAPAAEQYTGDEHQYVKDAVSNLRDLASVDWCIISAGFGLISEETKIPSYECTFNDMDSVREGAKLAGHDVEDLTNNQTIESLGKELQIPVDLKQTLDEGYDLLFVVLGEKYLISVADSFTELPGQTTAFAFASEGNKRLIGDCYRVPSTETERSIHETTHMRLKGKQLCRFSERIDKRGLKELHNNKEFVHELSV